MGVRVGGWLLCFPYTLAYILYQHMNRLYALIYIQLLSYTFVQDDSYFIQLYNLPKLFRLSTKGTKVGLLQGFELYLL